MKYLTVNKPEGSKEYDWADLTGDNVKVGGFEKPTQNYLTYTTGTNVKLIHKAEYCQSVIADGQELITGNESGPLVVPELNDEKVYITFKDDVTDFSDAFLGCTLLTSIPENLFANCTKSTSFYQTFAGSSITSIPENLFANCSELKILQKTFSDCKYLVNLPSKLNIPNIKYIQISFQNCTSLEVIPENLFANCQKVISFNSAFKGCSALQSIPENLFANNLEVTDFTGTFMECLKLEQIPNKLFDNNRMATHFSYTFQDCTGLTGKSPYTMVDGKKVHLYERKNYPEHFTKPTGFSSCFKNCTGLSDYAQIPSNWK